MTRELGPNWSGVLTVKNIQQVAKLLRRFLEGKKFTLLMAYDPPRHGEIRERLELGRQSGYIYNSEVDIVVHHSCRDSWINIVSVHRGDAFNCRENPFLSFNQKQGVISICQTNCLGKLAYTAFFIEKD